jgi:hypothetical protein
VVELSGSFSATLPPALADVLSSAPTAQTVRLESPGGDLRAALAVAAMIRAHGLDTYVGRLCASACTLAFLGGRHRFPAPAARLGFHQGSAAGLLPERLDPILRAAYAKFNVPASFIDHVLHTPPESLWIPSEAEMRDAGFVTGPPPGAVAVTDDPVSPDWVETMKLTAGHQTRPCSSSPASCP